MPTQSLKCECCGSDATEQADIHWVCDNLRCRFVVLDEDGPTPGYDSEEDDDKENE